MKTITKQHKVVLLSTDRPTQISIGKSIKSVFYTPNSDIKKLEEFSKLKLEESEIFQHLYVLSDEEIKEGDWCLYLGRFGAKILCKAYKSNTDFVYQEYGKNPIQEYGHQSGGITPLKYEIFKIISSNNPELKYIIKNHNDFDSVFDFEKPTDEFIQQWIDKGCPEVINVEYEKQDCCGHFKGCDLCPTVKFERIKINPDNTINCSLIEDDWNDILNKFVNSTGEFVVYLDDRLESWLKENYHPPTKK